MNNKLSKKETLLVGVMLFSLFFGAGNLIFPPFLGQEAGSNTIIAMIGFLMSAVGFPILGVIVVSKTNGLSNLASKVNPKFSFVFTILIYLSIGPLLGIPRAGSLPYEMVLAPYVSETFLSQKNALLLFTVCFFSIAFWLALKPNKLVDRMGKVLTPALLLLIMLIFAGSFFVEFGDFPLPQGKYMTSPLVSGFLDGYQTLDTIAALNFGLVISLVIKDLGIKDKKTIIKSTLHAGIIAGTLLILIYSTLSYLGALSGGQVVMAENGAQTLSFIVTQIFGPYGLFLLAFIFTLACLTTAVGLISSISQYFSSISKFNYRTWLIIFVLWSLFISNFGLTTILRVSLPLLNALYPLALVLIVLALLDKYFISNTKVYKYTVSLTSFLSILKVADDAKFLPTTISTFAEKIPFYALDMGWVLPSIILTSIIIFIENN